MPFNITQFSDAGDVWDNYLTEKIPVTVLLPFPSNILIKCISFKL